MPSEKFEQALAKVKTLPSKPSSTDLLKLYGLYKQATEGDASGERPGGFDFKAAAKFDAWSKNKGLSSADAEQAYIALVDELAAK